MFARDTEVRPIRGDRARERALKRLIVNADDFGYTRGVNRAIVEACRNVVVTSTSQLANGVAFEDAVEQAGQEPPFDFAPFGSAQGRQGWRGSDYRLAMARAGPFNSRMWRPVPARSAV